MRQKTLNYSFVRAICFVMLFVPGVSLYAQSSDSGKEKEKTEAVYFPLYNGLTVSTDIYGLGASVLGSDFLSAEIAVEASLKNRFFPIVEIGYGTTDTSNEKGIYYKSSAPYFRIGMNYNTMYKKGNPNFLYVGFRYGYTSFSYDTGTISFTDDEFGGSISNPNITDPIWGGSIPFNQKGLKASMGWIELLAGVRAHIYKDFYMGWSVRYRRKMNASLSDYGDPWYVPGFGTYDSNCWGLSYSLIYKLPL